MGKALKNTDQVKDERLRSAMGLFTDRTLTLKDIAEQSGFNSLPHFHITFKREFETTAGAFRRKMLENSPVEMTSRVLQKAIRYLNKPYKPVAAVARDLGFETRSEFVEQFKAAMDVDPRTYRVDNWEQIIADLPAHVRKAMFILDEDPNRPAMVVASDVGFDYSGDIYKNASKFNVYFNRAVGISPVKYANLKSKGKARYLEKPPVCIHDMPEKDQLRAYQEIRALLTTTHMTVRDIGDMYGFGARGVFTQSFMEKFGVTPSAFRARFWVDKTKAFIEDDPKCVIYEKAKAEFGIKQPTALTRLFLRHTGMSITEYREQVVREREPANSNDQSSPDLLAS